MKPGRELDALVAERVMGYIKKLVPKDSLQNIDLPKFGFPRQDSHLFVKEGGYPDYFMGHVNDMYVDTSRGVEQTLPNVPCYSTDIAAAWEVVEKFAEKDGHHSPAITSAFLGEGKAKGWCVSLGGVHSVFGETAPHAICLAALKAVGVEVP